MDNLKCTVTNCLYNSSEQCTAEHLNVYSSGDGMANSSDGTGCKTFKPKRHDYNESGSGMGIR
jgi:hypothetical protein